jgi:L-fucose isomerase-like protein
LAPGTDLKYEKSDGCWPIPLSKGRCDVQLPIIRAGFVGFGEINSPRELIETKCRAARDALEARGLELVYTEPVRDDPAGAEEARARRELAREPFDLLVVCIAGWIPSQTVINVIGDFAHKPMVLWGLTGYMAEGRLVTTADQAGTSALRDPMEALGFRFKYLYDCPDGPVSAADQVVAFARVVQTAAALRHARIGMMGYRDMKLYGTLVDGVSLRRVVGPEVEVFDTLEVVQKMEAVSAADIAGVMQRLRRDWVFDAPATDASLEPGVRMYLAVLDKVRERGYAGISLCDVDGAKKLLHVPPAMVLKLLADEGGVASIPENDGPGAVTQLIVRCLTGQVGAYFEFYEFMTDRVLLGVPDYVPSAVVDGAVHVRPSAFGGLSGGILDVSRVKTGRVTICRLASRGERYRLHIATGEAVAPRKWEEAGWAPPAPQLPGVEIVLDGSTEAFCQNVLGQHYILAYGDWRRSYSDLCRLLGIEVVA